MSGDGRATVMKTMGGRDDVPTKAEWASAVLLALRVCLCSGRVVDGGVVEWWPGGNEEREADDGLTDDVQTKVRTRLFSGKK
eukprot:scaffold506_cov202-Alexandrium_tamarense.AAC.3